MPVVLHIPNRAEPMKAETHTVSQNGAMILVPEAIGEGTKLSLENPRNQKRVDARVVRPPQLAQGGSLVPVEFTDAVADVLGGIFSTRAELNCCF